MEIRLSGEAAERIVENIEAFLDLDNITDDVKYPVAEARVFALQLMLEDVLRQTGRLPEKLTDDARKVRTNNPYYLPLT